MLGFCNTRKIASKRTHDARDMVTCADRWNSPFPDSVVMTHNSLDYSLSVNEAESVLFYYSGNGWCQPEHTPNLKATFSFLFLAVRLGSIKHIRVLINPILYNACNLSRPPWSPSPSFPLPLSALLSPPLCLLPSRVDQVSHSTKGSRIVSLGWIFSLPTLM